MKTGQGLNEILAFIKDRGMLDTLENASHHERDI